MIGLFLLLSISHLSIVISVGYIGLILIKASTEISWIGTADKTLWDWLDLFGTLIVPILLVVLGFSFARSENRRAQAIADQQARSSALQRYLEQMGVLLIDKRLRDERDTTELRTQGRALTLSILDGLGPEGKRSVLRYLHGSQLIYKDNVVVSLGGADLTDANLEEISLATPVMGSADMSGPDNIYERAEREDLYPLDFARSAAQASLAGASLRGAKVRGAYLVGCDLDFAHLEGANLTDVNVKDASLMAARGVTD